MVNNLAGLRETWVRFLDQEDALEKEMETHSSILAWRIPWTEEPGYSPWGCKESDTTEQLTLQNIVYVKKSLTNLFLKRKKRKLGRRKVTAFTSL